MHEPRPRDHHEPAARMNSPSRIAFDTWVLGSYAAHQGIHVYAKRLLENFQQLASQFDVEVSPFIAPGTDNFANQFSAAPGFQPKPTRLLKHSRSWRWGGALLLTARARPDLVFSPNCTTLYLRSLVPSVVTIHDLSPLVVHWGPQKIATTLRFLLWRAARSSRAVITDSLHSKMDLINHYGLPESKVFVVYLGCDKEAFNNRPLDDRGHRELTARLGISRPYILHHGVIKPYKNLTRLIQAYRLLLERNRNLDFDLVLAGPLGWEYAEVVAEAARCDGSRCKVIFAGALTDQDLATLVKGAALEIIPSLYEGFCLPMVEAMSCGVPTIAANSSCLPEISGGVLRYFDPTSLDEIAGCMEEALEDTGLQKELSSKGMARAAQFDWRRCASETLDILAGLARQNGNGGGNVCEDRH